RLTCEPVEIEALVALTECVERVSHPDSAAGKCDLLPKDTVRQNWRSVGALQRFVEQRSARTGRQRPAPQAERRKGGAQCECRCRQAKRAGGAEVQGSRSRHRCEEEEPDAAPRCSDSQDRQGRK